MAPHEVATRFLQDPANVPIRAQQVIDCLVGADFSGDEQARLRCLTSLLEGAGKGPSSAQDLEATLLRNVASWGSRVYTFREQSRSEVAQPTRVILPEEALMHLRGTRTSTTFGSEWKEAAHFLSIVTEWQRQTGNFLTPQDCASLRNTAEGLIPFVSGYNQGWWSVAAGIGELIGQPIQSLSVVVSGVSCEVRNQPSTLPTYDLLARAKGASEPALTGRVTILGEGEGRPWLLIESALRKSEDDSLSMPSPELAADALPAILKAAFPGRDFVSPVIITRQSGGPVHRRLLEMNLGTIIPITGTSTALATGESHVEGPRPATVPTLPAPYPRAAEDALRGAALREQCVTVVESRLGTGIPPLLAAVVREELQHFNWSSAEAPAYLEGMRAAMTRGTLVDILMTLGSSPRQRERNSTLHIVVNRLHEAFPGTSPSLSSEQVEAIAKLGLQRDRHRDTRRTDVQALYREVDAILGIARSAPVSTNEAAVSPPPPPLSPPAQTATTGLALTPRADLPKSGPLFNRDGKLLLFVASEGGMFHTNPTCQSITGEAQRALIGRRAEVVLATASKSACCKGCHPPDKAWQIPKWEASWAKSIPQRVVEEGGWKPADTP